MRDLAQNLTEKRRQRQLLRRGRDAWPADRRAQPIPLEKIRTVIDINVIGTFNVLRLAAHRMLDVDLDDGERGTVINTVSVVAFEGQLKQADDLIVALMAPDPGCGELREATHSTASRIRRTGPRS